MIFKTVTTDTNKYKKQDKVFWAPVFQMKYDLEGEIWEIAEQVSKCWEIEQVDENSELKEKLKNFGSKGKTGRHTLPLLTPALYGAKKQIIL